MMDGDGGWQDPNATPATAPAGMPEEGGDEEKKDDGEPMMPPAAPTE